MTVAIVTSIHAAEDKWLLLCLLFVVCVSI